MSRAEAPVIFEPYSFSSIEEAENAFAGFIADSQRGPIEWLLSDVIIQQEIHVFGDPQNPVFFSKSLHSVGQDVTREYYKVFNPFDRSIKNEKRQDFITYSYLSWDLKTNKPSSLIITDEKNAGEQIDWGSKLPFPGTRLCAYGEGSNVHIHYPRRKGRPQIDISIFDPIRASVKLRLESGSAQAVAERGFTINAAQIDDNFLLSGTVGGEQLLSIQLPVELPEAVINEKLFPVGSFEKPYQALPQADYSWRVSPLRTLGVYVR